MNDPWMTAEEAAHVLGVTRSTLYAYVSRGLVHSARTSGARHSRYQRREVERLAMERERARKPAMVARASLDWGQPVLSSELTLIEDGRLYYRGRDAVAFSRDASLERAATLLLGCDPIDFDEAPLPIVAASTLRAVARLETIQGCTAGFTWLHGLNVGDETLPPIPSVAQHCSLLLRLMTAVVTRQPPALVPAHQQLASSWKLDKRGADLIRRALVLCADHELNASSFAARCVASTGAGLGACVTAGLTALSGSRHCGITTAIEALWERTSTTQPKATEIDRLIDESLDASVLDVSVRAVSGFGHPLYPEGDPRAQSLLAELPRGSRNERLLTAVYDRSGLHPSIDYALVALRRSLGLPEGHAYLIFALGRTVGWMAHAIEQGRSDVLIRPRAEYTGPRPLTEVMNVERSLPSRIIRRR